MGTHSDDDYDETDARAPTGRGEFLSEKLQRLRAATEIVSYKWHPQILFTTAELDGASYSEIDAAIEGISSKMLADGLGELCEEGYLEQTEPVPDSGRTVYHPTDEGETLVTFLRVLTGWYERRIEDRLTVLIVENERMVADVISTFLADSYSIRHATNGTEALDRYDRDVDIVVLDRKLPDIDGGEVASEIKDRDEETLVLAVSSVDPDEELLDLPVDDYLQKPVKKAQIRKRLELLSSRGVLDERAREYLALCSKQKTLVAAYGEAAKDTDTYARLAELKAEFDFTPSRRAFVEQLVPDPPERRSS